MSSSPNACAVPRLICLPYYWWFSTPDNTRWFQIVAACWLNAHGFSRGQQCHLVVTNVYCKCSFTLQVGKAMSSNESAAYEIMKSLDVDYVLIIFGGVIGYSGDDINKFLWMVRIAEGEHPKDIRVCFHGNHDGVVGVTCKIVYSYKPWTCYDRFQVNADRGFSLQESDYFTPQGEFRVDKAGSPTLLNCLMYKMSYYRFGEMQVLRRVPPRLLNEVVFQDVLFFLSFFPLFLSSLILLHRLVCANSLLLCAAGLPYTTWVWPDKECWDRQQGHPSETPWGGVYFRALAGANLQSEEAGEPAGCGPQAPQRRSQTEVHLKKGTISHHPLVYL